MRKDFRYSIRLLRKTPSWTALVALTIALGIGGTATMFSIVNAVLLRPLPVPQPNRLYWISEHLFNFGQEMAFAGDYFTIREEARTFSQMAAFNTSGVNWTGTDRPQQLIAARVTASFFPLFGIEPLYGDTFRPEDDTPRADAVVVLSYALWRRSFGGDPSILGKTMRLDREAALVIGIMPKRFDFPKGAELWLPFRLNETEQRQRQKLEFVGIVARAKAGVSVGAIGAEANRLTPIVENEYRANGVVADAKVIAASMQEHLAGRIRPAILVLCGAVVLFLIIACFNVANLMLARASGRHREIIIRAALGAPRKRIISQVLTESLIVSLLGAALGIGLTNAAAAILNSFRPVALAEFPEISTDAASIAFAFILSLLLGLGSSLAPAMKAAGFPGREALQGERRTSGSRGLLRVRQGLVVAQLGASLTLLIGAGLLAKSFLKLRDVDPGFRSDGVLTARINLAGPAYSSSQRQIEFYERLLAKLHAIPAIVSAALTTSIPFNDNGPNAAAIEIENRPANSLVRQEFQAGVMDVSPDFFSALSIPLLEGRLLDARDGPGTPATVVVNEAFRHSFFADEDPVGRRIRISGRSGPWLQIIGVVGNVRQNLDRSAGPWLYQSYLQVPDDDSRSLTRVGVVIRTSSDSAPLSSTVVKLVGAIDPDQVPYDLKTLERRVASSLASRRFYTVWIGGFAAIAMLLAAIGVYGVISYLMTMRTQEIGIRIALGARPVQVLRLVCSEGLMLGLTGGAIGLSGAYGFRRFVSALLVGVSASEPGIYAGCAIALLVVALAACYGPAVRSARADPLISLRHR
jgi:putative ABC transport system permease protein